MNLEPYQEDLEYYFKLYCIESVPDADVQVHSKAWRFLERLASDYNIHNIYKACEDMEGLEASLGQLIYEDMDTSDYRVLYFILEGDDNEIILTDSVYRLKELAEMFEGRLHDKVIHFANTKSLDLTEESFQYFLYVTGATAVSSYVYSSTIFSAALDMYYFSLYREYDDVVELVHKLYETHGKLYHAMGFRLYY